MSPDRYGAKERGVCRDPRTRRSIGSALAPIVGQNATGGLVKIPGILADIGVAWLLYAIAR